MTPGFVFVSTALYLTFLVALVVSLLDQSAWDTLLGRTLRRWGKFLLGLAGLAMVVQILTWIG